jgi:uncharacterized membrane protein
MSEQINPYGGRPPAVGDSQRNLAMIIYILYGAAIFVGLTSIVAIVMNYIKRDEVRGTWLESHFNWQIKTFWWTLIWGVIGTILTLVLVGFVILFAVFVWYVYRIAKGLIYLNDRKPIQ